MSLAQRFNRRREKKTEGVSAPKKRPINKHVTTTEKINKNIKNFLEDNALPRAYIDELSFSTFTKETIKKLSVCNIDNVNASIDPTGSLEDPRMGTIENFMFCSTCNKSNDSCTGHMAIMNLPVYFIHPFFREETIHTLNSICQTCNKLLISEKNIKEHGIDRLRGISRLKKIAELSQKFNCSNPRCAMKLYFKNDEKDVYNRSVSFYTKKDKKERNSYMSVEEIKKKLDFISDKDARTLGFNINHPSNFVINYLPIIPLNDRPYNILNGEKKEHELTQAYKEILGKNLESMQYDNEDKKEECYKSILKLYSLLIKNNPNEYTSSAGGPLKSITSMIVSKEGLIRGNMMGKRCDYTGRTVLGSNDRLNFGSLAIPRKMEKLTIPEIITVYNYDHIINLAKEGKIVYFCPKEKNLAGVKAKFVLEKYLDKLAIGDKVERYNEEGDNIVFNRQPTLHKNSLLGYKIVFQDKLTIGVHLSSAGGHNADFDGDEGNLHLVQTPAAQIEAQLLMSSKNCIISSGKSVPEAALVYNSVTSAFLMTRENIPIAKKYYDEAIEYVTSRMVSNYVTVNMATLEERLGNINKYSTFGLFSVLFPADFWFMNSSGGFIKNGILQNGKGISKSCQENANGIVQVLFKKYGKEIASDFISSSNFLLNWYIFREGFSLAINDIMISKEKRPIFNEERDKIIYVMNNELNNLPELPDNATARAIEEKINMIGTITSKNMKKITDFFQENILDPRVNSIDIMSNSGAKGNNVTLNNVISTLGQIFIDGNLPAKKLCKNRRWLSSFSVNDNSAYSNGFSKNSYFEGMEPDAFFAQAQSGRLSLMNTALTTRTVGYQTRKMVKAQEDLILNYDGSIRNKNGIIYQTSYGYGFEPTKMVLDNSDNNFPVFSFINIKQLCGELNNENGFSEFNLDRTIKSFIDEVNSKYNFQTENNEINESGNDENMDDNKLYIEDEYLDFDFDIE